MELFFNNAGPIKPELHYNLDPLNRLDWIEIQQLIREQRYFVLHAPRQTGKTSTLLAIMKELNASGNYACAYANIEGAQAARGDETQGIPAACDAIVAAVRRYLNNSALSDWYYLQKTKTNAQHLLTDVLEQWAKTADKPTVLLLDEVDALIGDTLISLLRQIRAGYAQRPEHFPQSIILCGVRDVRDYRMHQEGAQVITGGSAFNIKAKSLRMGNFTQEETKDLWLQHTQATGQQFAEAIFPELWLDTEGQPWLVNALGYELTWENRTARDRSYNITLTDYKEARERLIQSRATHLDQLADKLREHRVQAVMNAIIGSKQELRPGEVNPDDVQYVIDLGLIKNRPSLRISNRIYQEVIPRELTWVTQSYIANQEQSWY
ncbi:MAG: AAA-like domain-containing protein, partial [Desulfuromonadaceae bacterium]|nr:AAA-like domain-containing protein [Desulfuromonadaceae bacterium]